MGQSPQSAWDGEFGEAYTRRSTTSVEEMDELYLHRFGVSRTELNREFLQELDRDIRILEVGCNTGTQLECFQRLGFTNLYGIDIQEFAIETAHRERPELHTIKADAENIPYKDGFFDLVFTSGVLIHVPPKTIDDVLAEIVRCSSQFVFGYEYYADQYEEIEYRDNSGLLWKANFPKMYQDSHDLELVDQRELQYPDGDKTDVMFLLKQ